MTRIKSLALFGTTALAFVACTHAWATGEFCDPPPHLQNGPPQDGGHCAVHVAATGINAYSTMVRKYQPAESITPRWEILHFDVSPQELLPGIAPGETVRFLELDYVPATRAPVDTNSIPVRQLSITYRSRVNGAHDVVFDLFSLPMEDGSDGAAAALVDSVTCRLAVGEEIPILTFKLNVIEEQNIAIELEAGVDQLCAANLFDSSTSKLTPARVRLGLIYATPFLGPGSRISALWHNPFPRPN